MISTLRNRGNLRWIFYTWKMPSVLFVDSISGSFDTALPLVEFADRKMPTSTHNRLRKAMWLLAIALAHWAWGMIFHMGALPLFVVSELPLLVAWRILDWPRQEARRLFPRILATSLILGCICAAAATTLMMVVPTQPWGWLLAFGYFVACLPVSAWHTGYREVRVAAAISYFIADTSAGNWRMANVWGTIGLADPRSLQQGQVVGLILCITARGRREAEFMWAVVDGIDWNNLDGYRGHFLVRASCAPEIAAGSEVRFRPKHVVAIGDPGDDSNSCRAVVIA